MLPPPTLHPTPPTTPAPSTVARGGRPAEGQKPNETAAQYQARLKRNADEAERKRNKRAGTGNTKSSQDI